MKKRKLSIEEIKTIEIGILNYFTNLCNAYHLTYFLDGGTLLGAIRHKGFIPWDDDIDVIMPRKDYDFLVHKLCIDDDRYALMHVCKCKKYVYPYAKMVDKKTEIIELGEDNPGYGLFIDIFPLDRIPDAKLERESFQKKLWNLNHLWGYSQKSFPQKETITQKSKWFYARIVGKKNIMTMMDHTARKYEDTCASYGYNILTSPKLRRLNRYSNFDSSIKVQFEDNYYNAPIGYDEYLTDLYGDYMKLPPEEERVSNHNFEAFLVDG